MSTRGVYVFGTLHCDTSGCNEKVEDVKMNAHVNYFGGFDAGHQPKQLPAGWTQKCVKGYRHYCPKCSLLR